VSKVKGIFKKSSLEPGRLVELKDFCKRVNIKFNNLELLNLAFCHRSSSNENKTLKHQNNERLEFLGDSVLGMATATFLYADMEENPEGDLAKIKSVVVSEKSLAPVARRFGIDKLLILGKGEEMSGGRQKDAILADCVEAVIGAYYLDRGYEEAEKFVLSFIEGEVKKVQEDRGQKDYKTLLQEHCQKKFKQVPVYELVKETGPDHDRTFWVSVKVKGVTYGPESGKNKKTAEQSAAGLAYRMLTEKQ
jgi:ribonuclease-3